MDEGCKKYIVYNSGNKSGVLECLSDTDFEELHAERQTNLSGVLVLYAGGEIILAKSTLVYDEATSAIESEVVEANETEKELIWLMRLINGDSFGK